jgi:hypothetical protein
VTVLISNGDCPLTQLMEICQINQNIFRKKSDGYKLSNISALITIGIFKNYKRLKLQQTWLLITNSAKKGEYNGKFTVGYSGRLKE